MHGNSSNQFDDPILKSAVKRTWGDQRAPGELRDRVAAMLSAGAEEIAPTDSAPMRMAEHSAWQLPTWVGYAAAALVLLVVGLIGWQFLDTAGRPGNGGPVMAGGLPVSFVNDIVHTHDHCCNFENHHTIDAPRDDFQLIRHQLEDRLGEPVWVIDATNDGWQFRGAAICHVKGRKSAHLLYDRPPRNQTLSVLSVPYDGECSLPNGEVVTIDTQTNHPVAGFRTDGEFHCLVGHSPDGSLTIDELRRMTERYQGNLQIVRIAYPNAMAASRQEE